MGIKMRKYKVMGLFSLLAVLFLSGCALHKGTARDSESLSADEYQKFEYFYLEAERMKAIGENDAAFDLMRRAADIDTTSAAARFFLAPYYLRMGLYEQARKDLHYAAETYPDNYWYNVVYANFSQQSG